MEASLGIKNLSGQGVSKSHGLKKKTTESSAAAFGVVLQKTVSKSKATSLKPSTEEKLGINFRTLKQQVLQAIGELNQEKSPLSADQSQFKGLLEQLLKNIDSKNGESETTLKTLTPMLKNLNEALEKQKESTTDSQDSPWSQLLSTVQALILQGQAPIQKEQNQRMGDAIDSGLKTTGSPKAGQTLSLSLMTASAELKGSRSLANKNQPILLQNNESNQSVSALSVEKDDKGMNPVSALKTPKVTKGPSLSPFMPDKPQSKDLNGKPGINVSAMLAGGRPLDKVQQFLFHQSTAVQPEPSPADQIANQIKALMSQGALKSSEGQLSINLNLHPDNLGAVQLAITQTDGGLTASITAHSSLTKDLIDSQLTHLQQALQASGIEVYKLDVNLAPTPSGQSDPTYQPPQDQGQGRNQGQHQSHPEEQVIEGPEFETWLKEGLET